MNTIFAFAAGLLTFANSHTMTTTIPEGAHRIVRLGWSPESLVLAGLTTGDLAALLAHADASDSAFELLDQRGAAAQAAADALTAAQQGAWANPGDRDRAGALALAEQEYEATAADERAAFAAAAGAVLAAIDEPKALALQGVAARAGDRIPEAWKVVALTDDQASALEAALRSEQRAARSQGDDAEAPALAEIRSRQDVADAQQRLAASLAAFAAAFSAQ